jgi:hypothetical protein
VIHQWFEERGFGVSFTAGSDSAGNHVCWADLTSLRTGAVFAPKYGRGIDESSALERAKRRYETEQGAP